MQILLRLSFWGHPFWSKNNSPHHLCLPLALSLCRGFSSVQGQPGEEKLCLFLLIPEGAVLTGPAGTSLLGRLSHAQRASPCPSRWSLTHTLMASTLVNTASCPCGFQDEEGVPCLLRKHSSVSHLCSPLKCEGEPGMCQGLAAPPAAAASRSPRAWCQQEGRAWNLFITAHLPGTERTPRGTRGLAPARLPLS